MSEEDRPPESIWLDDEKLMAHFKDISDQREASSKGLEAVPQADMQQNELTKGLA